MSINSIRFSNDNTTIAIALDHTFYIYSIEPFERKFIKDFINYKITKISSFGDGSLVAFSVIPISEDESESGEKVYIWDNQYGEAKAQLLFKQKIENLFLTKDYLIIIGITYVEVYDINQKSVILRQDTSYNPNGAGDILFSDDLKVIGICGNEPCTIYISEILSDIPPLVFKAHEHPIIAMKFSPDMSFVSTVSEKSTLVRIFDTITGTNLSAFRRGTMSSKVKAMCFSPDNKFLIVISESGTVHMFEADVRNGNPPDPPRAIAKFKIEKSQYIEATFQNPTDLMIVTSSGYLHIMECSSKTIKQKSKIFIMSH